MKKYGSWLAICVLVCACSGKKSDSSASSSSSGEAAQSSAAASSGASAGSSASQFDFLGALLAQRLDEPGPYDEPRHSPGYDEDEEHFAVLELSGPIVELAAISWLSGSTSGVELRAVTEKLRELAANSNVKGLLVRAGNMSMSIAAAEELRGAFEIFKGDGKRKLFCHTEGVSNFTYYVLSACDSIALAPSGQLIISGVAAIPLHMKKLLGKLGVRADFLQVGAYKSAAEPLIRDQPSKEQTETIAAILDRAYETLVAGIAAGRSLSHDKARVIIDKATFTGEEALAERLIDNIDDFADYRSWVLSDVPWSRVAVEESAKPDMATMMRFLGLAPRPRPSEPHVALVYAVGSIIDGKGSGIVGARQEIASRTLVSALRAMGADESVKAIVLRIDSGGGSALASELILQTLIDIRKTKPVVVSMAGVAASGGYYIACAANRVFALDNTITGSIGVVGGKLAMRGALDELGIGVFPMGRGKRALMNSPYDTWNNDERSAIKAMMEDIYRTFVNRVAEGRNLALGEVEHVAQGRAWTGAAAREHRLVDQAGGLSEALAEARKLGGVPDDAELEVYPPEPTLLDVVGSFGQVQAPLGLAARAADVFNASSQILGHGELRAIATVIEQLALLRDSPVLAATFFPVVIQ